MIIYSATDLHKTFTYNFFIEANGIIRGCHKNKSTDYQIDTDYKENKKINVISVICGYLF
jgi:hypothetical protein